MSITQTSQRKEMRDAAVSEEISDKLYSFAKLDRYTFKQRVVIRFAGLALYWLIRAIGDPAFVKADVSALMERMRLLDRRAQIALDRTRPAAKFSLQEHGTTHLVVVDPQGNVVSLTTTINDAFGSMVSTETTGVILNNELDDFATKAVTDILTTGAHFKAAQQLLLHRFPGIPVAGIFLARTLRRPTGS